MFFAHLTRIVRSASFRLTLLYFVLFVFSVGALVAVIYWSATRAMESRIAASVRMTALRLAEEQQKSGLAGLIASVRHQMSSRARGPVYYLVQDPAGRVLVGNLVAMRPVDGVVNLTQPAGESGDQTGEVLGDVGSAESSDGGSAGSSDGGSAGSSDGGSAGSSDGGSDGAMRIVAFGVTLPDGTYLLVGEDASGLSEVGEAVFDTFVWAGGVTLALALAGGFVLSATFLHRIDAVNRTSRAIVDGNLAARVPTRGTEDELDQLAINLNTMLDRIQTLMEGLRQVSNDIAHDLRTPLGRLRQRLEATRNGARTVAEYEVATDAALKETDAILDTFSALLRIAQIEAGTRRSAFADVDLSDVMRSVAETYAPVAEETGDALAADIVDGVTVKGDRQLLVQMLANLVENAIRHTPRGTVIRIALTHGPTGIEVRVADDGPGIPEAERDKVFKRFYRLEQSRTTPGGGLGLALVKAVADLHGIALRLENRRPGLEVVLVLPIPPAAAVHGHRHDAAPTRRPSGSVT